MNKKIIAILLSVLLLLGILPAQVLAADAALPADAVSDTDYDGIPDQNDPDPNSNSFSGTYRSGDFTANLQYTMDYRNFFGDNTVYNQTIADFSTWAAQLTYENEENETTYTPSVALPDSNGASITKVYHIDQLMRAHGMEDVIDYKLENGYFDDDISLGAYSDDDITEVYFGHHKVSFGGETIEVVAVFVRGTNGTIQEWSSNFNVGNLYRFGQEFDAAEGKLRFPNAEWKRKTNHRGFDVTANRIRAGLKNYVETFLDPEAAPVFWLTGHSRGGAVSNILSSYLVDEGEKVFAYTFASPNTTANTEASAAKYDCIFNLVNGDDFVPRLPMPEWGFARYGRTALKYACLASNSERSTYLGNTSYNYKSDSDLQAICDKFSAMTRSNAGGNDGWRDVNVYHCGHQHADEQSGEYRTGCTRTRQWSELIGWGESMFNGWSQRVQRYAYWSSQANGICETPAYAMQVLAELMGNLSLSGGWDYLTTNKLADRYDFGKTSLVSYATGIIDPHYMENYYLIQKLLENQGDPDSAYHTANSLYTDENGRPVHEHSYTFHFYEGKEPSCTQEGEGYKICECSQIDPAWYDDVVNDIRVPALGHEYTYEYVGASTHAVSCTRCDESFPTEPCTYVNNVCTVCGHVKAASRVVSVYVVDELDGQSLCAWAWGDAGNLDANWPGHALTALGVDKSGHPYYSIDLDIADYNMLVFNRNGQPQTGNLDILADADEEDYVVYYIYGVSGNDLSISQGTDIWPGPGSVTEPTCTEPGFTTYYGMFTGATLTGEETPALGHSYEAEVNEPSCTAPGYVTWTCACCGDSYTELTAEALGHDYAAVVTEPSCTEAGYTTYTCSRCGDTYVGDETAALGHLPGETVQENYVEPAVGVEGGYDTVVCCQRCGEELSREHTVLPALPNPEPIETSDLRIYSSISVGTDMVVTWTARKSDVANYEKFWIEVVKHGAEGDESYLYGDEQEEALDESTSTWQVNFKHIFAKEMGVEIEARVYAEDANGQIYMSPAKSTNIRDYLGGRLTLTNNTVEQRVLAADMLNYGAAAQLFGNYNTEHLVNEELTAEQLAKLDEYETKERPVVEKTNSNYRPEGQSNILFNSVSLDNEVLLTLTVRAAEGADVKVLMKDHESGTVVETLDTEWVGSNYVVNYSGIGADKMRVAYDFTARIDGAETGNVRTWSVEGYVGELRSGSNQLQINVANALLAYGDAAAAYFAAQ